MPLLLSSLTPKFVVPVGQIESFNYLLEIIIIIISYLISIIIIISYLIQLCANLLNHIKYMINWIIV